VKKPSEKTEESFVFLTPPIDAYLTAEGLDKWAYETNGTLFTKETKDELFECFDVTDDGNLTYGKKTPLSLSNNKLLFFLLLRFKGFLQIYQLQTGNDEEETWRDLVHNLFP
jgi:hypothetical protein